MAVSISQLTELTSILDDDVFPVTAVRSTKSTGKVKYSTIKQNILDSVPTPVSDWSDITNKPFTSIGSGLTVSGGVLSASGLDFTALSGMIVQGTNMSIITDSNAKTITFNATGGIDFDALSTAMTTGTQSGITVTADTENSRFNFEVTGIPTIAIDSEGYWTIDGERGRAKKVVMVSPLLLLLQIWDMVQILRLLIRMVRPLLRYTMVLTAYLLILTAQQNIGLLEKLIRALLLKALLLFLQRL